MMALASRLAFFLFVAFSLPQAKAEGLTLAGTTTHVRDGDTIEVNGIAVRLEGLHAPELGTASGQKAADFMQALTLNKEIVCQLTGEQNRDREIGVCWLGEKDVAAQLVAAGLGRDCPRYSNGRYADIELESAKEMPLPGYCKKKP